MPRPTSDQLITLAADLQLAIYADMEKHATIPDVHSWRVLAIARDAVEQAAIAMQAYEALAQNRPGAARMLLAQLDRDTMDKLDTLEGLNAYLEGR